MICRVKTIHLVTFLVLFPEAMLSYSSKMFLLHISFVELCVKETKLSINKNAGLQCVNKLTK